MALHLGVSVKSLNSGFNILYKSLLTLIDFSTWSLIKSFGVSNTVLTLFYKRCKKKFQKYYFYYCLNVLEQLDGGDIRK